MTAVGSRRSRIAVSIVLALVVLAVLYGWGGADWREMARTIAGLPPSSFAIAFAIHTAIYLARAERFRLLMPASERPPRWPLLWVTSAHNLAVYALPAKTGEATLPLYLKATCGTRQAVGIASLVVSRVLDLASLTAILAVTTLVLAAREAWPGPYWLALLLAIAFGLAALASIALSIRGAHLVGVAERIARALRLDRSSLGVRLFQRAEELRDALRSAGATARGWAFTLSLAVWILIFAFYVVMASGFGLPESVSLIEAGFAAGPAVAMNLLPINSFAGLGTQEAGWVFGFGLVGVPPDAALASGVGAHLAQIFNTFVFGVAAHFAMAFARRK